VRGPGGELPLGRCERDFLPGTNFEVKMRRMPLARVLGHKESGAPRPPENTIFNTGVKYGRISLS